jgi:hypothetical protein
MFLLEDPFAREMFNSYAIRSTIKNKKPHITPFIDAPVKNFIKLRINLDEISSENQLKILQEYLQSKLLVVQQKI